MVKNARMKAGDPIDETGLLLRDGGDFFLRRDAGGRFLLVLRRMPVDEVQKQVRIIGTYAGDDVVEVDGVQLASPATPSTK